MKFTVLGSGSRGNSVYIEHQQTALLIDAGFSGKELIRRAAGCGISLDMVQAICLTHEHGDHIFGAGVISRRLRIPVHANTETFQAGENRLGKPYQFYEFDTGDFFEIGALQVQSFRISHDTADPVGYVISDGKSRLGYLTDTGKISHLMVQRLSGCNAVVLEFNHDLEMLKNGPYPLPLQQRVRSSRGHLCNGDAAEFLRQILHSRLRHVVLAHLSEKNNTPYLAIEAARAVIEDNPQVQLHLAMQNRALSVISL